MKSNGSLGLGNYWGLAGIIFIGIALLTGGIAQGAPQYSVTCDFCHTMPPLDSADGKRDPATGAVKGNHQNHAGATAASCAKCHGSGVTSYPTGHRDKLIAVQGNINNSPAAGGASYSRAFFNQTTVPPTPLGTCSNVNCHFESATYSWGSAAFVSPADCARCHGIAPATGNHPTAGSKHGNYYGTGTSSCQKCHPDHTSGGKAFAHATSVTNRGIAVRFTAAPNSGGSYSGDGLNFLPSQHKASFGTCTNLYCHSNGVAGGAPNTVPTWGASLDCTGCHNSNLASGAPMTTGKHGAHINNAATLGANYGCAECHARTVSTDTTIVDVSRHVSGFVDFSGARAGRSYSSGTGKCSNVYCHSDGKGNYKDMTVPNWKSTGVTLDCKGCHGNDAAPAFTSAAGEPNYANGGGGQGRANTHQRHVSGAADCINCHVNTVDGTGKLTGSSHANGTINVDFNPAKAGAGVTWTAGGKTCANISCHGTTSAQWGSTSCLGCHAVAQNNRAAITSQFGANSHHIQGAVTDDKCYQCHWEANSDGSINSTYHHSGTPGAPVELVVYGAGARPASYNNVNAATAVQYTANGDRAQLQKINSHCLGCHSTLNDGAQPFGDGKTPKQYAWDGKSVDARYSQSGTTTWGKYPAAANSAPKNIGKAYSAHGNAAANKRGWDTTNGVDGAITNTAGTVNVLCYDCHNSHGSTVAGATTRYTSATINGGILKDTTVSRSGYSVAYKPYSTGSEATRNKRNAGANLCLDCHLNQTAATTPWGYNSTFGANQPVLGYMDALMYKQYSTAGSKQRYPFKKFSPVKGGHFGASMAMTTTPSSAIGGLCTPCHDPHGVSPTLNQQYAVPLLKGTWLTSPYKEDVPPTNNGTQTIRGEGVQYHIDQNTFGSDIINPVTGITEATGDTPQNSQSAGLCLGCHSKSSLTNGTNGGTWKSVDRIHESVKGWGANAKHAYTCSKCHSAHTVSGLPRLMVTNCLDSRHKGKTAINTAPVINGSGSDHQYQDGYGDGSGRIPGSFDGEGWSRSSRSGPPGNYSVTCHENQTGSGTDQSWNMVTPWAVYPSPDGISAIPGNTQVTISWTVRAAALSTTIRYGMVSGNYTTTITASSPKTLTGLTNGTPIYYQVGAVYVSGTVWSAEGSVTPTASAPVAPSSITVFPGYYQADFSWSAVPGATSYSIRYGTAPGVYPTTVPATSPKTISLNTTSYYQVGASNAAGTTWSAEGIATPSPSAPYPWYLYPSAVTVASGQATITWPPYNDGSTSHAIRYGTATGAYTTTIAATSPQTITGLTNGTTYYYEIGALNAYGTTWGAEYTVTPSGPVFVPTVTSPTAATVGSTTATLGANVTSNGGALLTAVGTCWGSTASPATNCVPQGTTATGVFTQGRAGLPEGSLVYYRGYATNSAGTAYSSDGTTYTEPNQPNNLSFSGVGSSGITVNWATVSSGTAKNVIVVMKSGSSVDADPSDGATYAASAAFGSGAQIGTLNYVVYKGTGTSVPVTGLSPGTTYYVKVYAFAAGAAGGTENYNLTSPLTVSQATSAVVPTLTSPSATAIGSTTATLGANVTSNGGGALTAVGTCWGLAASPATNCVPQGTTATGVFTQGRAGLPEGSQIYYRGYATNSIGTAYSPDGTIYTEPTQPTTLSFASVAGNAITVNWVTGSSGNANVIVLMKAGSAVSADPVDGTPYTANAAFGSGTQIGTSNYVVYKGTGTSVAVTGLTPSTTYYVKVYAFAAGATGTENYDTTSPLAGSQATSAGSPPAAPTLAWPDNGYNGQVAYPAGQNLLQWNASAGATEYYCEVTNSSGVVVQSSDWTPALTYDKGELGDNDYYYWRVKARNAFGEGGWSETRWWYDYWSASSCPLVYSWNGAKYTYETDLQGPAISQIKKGVRNVTLYQPSYIVLQGLVPDTNNQYRIKIWESLNEATLLDEAKLLAVDFPAGYQIVSSGAENTYYYGYANPFTIYTIKDPVLPKTATDKYGNDILTKVLNVDDNPAPMDPADPDNFYTFDFGTIQHPENAKLVIDGWQIINSKLFTSTVTIQPYIEVVDASGAWVKVKTLGMPMGDLKTMIVDLSNKFLSSDQRIRLHLGIKKAQVWVIDRIRLDDSAPVNVTVQELSASSADLQTGGQAIKAMNTLQHRILVSDETLSLQPDSYGYGNFTRYGEVGDLLTQRDDKYVIMNYADKLEVTFPALAQPQPGTMRGFILKADNYYKEFKEYKYLEPLPFHAMSDYPPPAPEAYPTDADHQQYLLDYNTRILPGPANPVLTAQPSLTYASSGTSGITFQWSGVTAADGDSVVYLVEVSSAANMATISYQSTWQTGTSWTQTLPVGTWYWRVKAQDSIHTTSVLTSTTGTFSIVATP